MRERKSRARISTSTIADSEEAVDGQIWEENAKIAAEEFHSELENASANTSITGSRIETAIEVTSIRPAIEVVRIHTGEEEVQESMGLRISAIDSVGIKISVANSGGIRISVANSVGNRISVGDSKEIKDTIIHSEVRWISMVNPEIGSEVQEQDREGLLEVDSMVHRPAETWKKLKIPPEKWFSMTGLLYIFEITEEKKALIWLQFTKLVML